MKKLQILVFGFLLVYFLIQILLPSRYTFNADEGTHGLIGLFYKDLFSNIKNFKSFSDVTTFAVNYIVKYPKISAHYPPLYHLLISGVFFISESLFLVRIFNVFLTILTAYIIYKLSFILSKNKNIAIISSLFFLSFSIIFFYADKIMMDNLQILTFSLGLLYYLKLKEKKSITIKNIFLLSILFSAAFLTKFFSVFLPIIILIDSFFTKKTLIKYVLLASLISIVLISPYIFLYIKFGLYKLTINVASNQQIVNVGTNFSKFFNFFHGFDYLYPHALSKIDYFNVFKVFGLSVGLLVAASTIWYVWKNKKSLLIMSWIFIPMFIFLFLFSDVELRFLYILMPLFALACGSFIYNLMKKRNLRKIIVILSILILASQFTFDIYIKLQESFYPVEDVMKNIKGEGNVLIKQEMPLDQGVYSSAYILYSRLLGVKGNIIRPCVLENKNLTKDTLNDMGVKYIIDNNNSIDKTLEKSLGIFLIDEKKNDKTSVKIFERYENVTKIDCNFICNLQKKVCINESFSNILSVTN